MIAYPSHAPGPILHGDLLRRPKCDRRIPFGGPNACERTDQQDSTHVFIVSWKRGLGNTFVTGCMGAAAPLGNCLVVTFVFLEIGLRSKPPIHLGSTLCWSLAGFQPGSTYLCMYM